MRCGSGTTRGDVVEYFSRTVEGVVPQHRKVSVVCIPAIFVVVVAFLGGYVGLLINS